MGILPIALLTAAFSVLDSGDLATPDEARGMLKQFAQHYKEVGRSRALMDFDSGMRPYFDPNRDLYVVCVTPLRRVAAYGPDPKLVGSPMDVLKDGEGKPLGAAILKAGSAKAGGSVPFKARSAATGKLEPRVLFAQKFGNDVCGVSVRTGK